MEYLSDIILALAAFAVAIYCFVLSGRLKRFSTLENGMGSAIAVLSVQVDELTKAMEAARGAAIGSASRLEALNTRAEAAAALTGEDAAAPTDAGPCACGRCTLLTTACVMR